MHHVTIARDLDAPDLPDAQVEALVAAVLGLEQVDDGAVVSVVFADDVTVHVLNREYRGVDAPTDVLSFGLSDLAAPAGDQGHDDELDITFVLPPEMGEQLGEIVVSVETALRQAQEHRRAAAHELAHLIVHGVLHLLGHDHAEPEEEAVMRRQEDAALQACGFPPGAAGWSH